MGDLILAVNIPMETVTEITDSGSKTVERKVFPGYVLVKMVMTDETWHLVRNVRGSPGSWVREQGHPSHRRRKLPPWVWRNGKSWSTTKWATTSASPTARWSLSSVPWRKSTWGAKKVRVVVSMFGRETPVELDLDQIESI